ncbi:MAG: OadG family transporter subunit [Bacteroidota bacterium]
MLTTSILIQNPNHIAGWLLEINPLGLGMAVIALGIVFFSFVFLYFVFRILARIFANRSKRKQIKTNVTPLNESVSFDTTGEIDAAIALTIYLMQQQAHDIEDTVLTIKKVARTYTPWSSKIYGLRKIPRN